ncbi:MAG: aminotransferase class III-fold pyridoxal phosphate-dependent enzyme [Acidobacteria bacterium]|nr:aminotransferase class III-fold pyridoxal phosphate-dependent enzyme [Acidobacteriota bacterium]
MAAAAALAEKCYGIRATATPLPGERDQNFLLSVSPAKKYVLKIANALEERALLEAQNQVMSYLETRLSFCPRISPNLSGESLSEVESANGSVNFVRLVTYLPGVPLAEVKPHSPSLLQSLGERLGQLDRELAAFDHPALHRNFHWDLANAEHIIREYAPLVADEPLRQIVYRCRKDFSRQVSPLLSQLRRSVIHGDANDYNVLVQSGDDSYARHRHPAEAHGQDARATSVSGIIDFGDLVHSYTVGDLAVAIAYVVLDKDDPLAAVAPLVAGYAREHSLSEIEINALYGLVLMRLCMSVCLAAYQHRQRPDNDYLRISQRSIIDSLPGLAAIDWSQAAAAFHDACNQTESNQTVGNESAATLAARRKLLGPNLSIAYQEPIKIVRGSMQYLYDEDGRQYLDAYNNVAHVGHCRPRIVKVGQDQMALLNTNTRYLHDLILRYAERLAATLPDSLSVCFFVNSGSEANELALRLARAHTGGRDLLVLDHAYHGNTTTLIEISPYKHDGPGGAGAPSWVHKLPLPDLYRGLHRYDDPQAAGKYAEHAVEVIAELRERGVALSGFIAESLPSVAGQIVLPRGYLEKVYRAVREAGGVCIADEVQTGYGRIGTHFWGFESYAVVPDIVVLGKPIGNGHPIGAVITTPEIASSFANGMEFFSTFGGNTVSCAIGLAVLDIVLEENLQAHALSVGEMMLQGLRDLLSKHEIIGDIRGSGFFLGAELVSNRETLVPASAEADVIVNQMRQRGILLGTDGPFHSVLKIRPPLPFSASNSDRLISTLDDILSNLQIRV